jgi:ribosome maturation factor RimP
MMDAVREKIMLLLEPYLESQGFDLVDADLTCGHEENVIQVLADKPEGGITIEQCACLNKKIRELFDGEKILDGDYVLEVSSPGIDRPLTSVKDFLRSYGKEIVFYLKQPVDGKLEYQGVVQRVQGEHVYIKRSGVEVIIPVQFINKAKQVI